MAEAGWPTAARRAVSHSAIFLYLDELAAACAHGHAEARAEVAGSLNAGAGGCSA
jgi:hypothetical protein